MKDYIGSFKASCSQSAEDGATVLLRIAFRIAQGQKTPSLSGALQKALNIIHFLEPGKKYVQTKPEDFLTPQAEAVQLAMQRARSVTIMNAAPAPGQSLH